MLVDAHRMRWRWVAKQKGSDVQSICHLLYEHVTGQTPVKGDGMSTRDCPFLLSLHPCTPDISSNAMPCITSALERHERLQVVHSTVSLPVNLKAWTRLRLNQPGHFPFRHKARPFMTKLMKDRLLLTEGVSVHVSLTNTNYRKGIE